MGDPDVRALMLRMHRGDERAAETLWALFASRLTVYARAMLPAGLESSAEDVVQGVFIDVLEMRRGALRGVRDGTAFLFRMTRNRALNTGRGESRERARRRTLTRVATGFEIEEDVRAVLAGIQGLVVEQREVILLRYLGGLTIDQIAESVGAKRGTVASRNRLGMKRLRDVLGAEVSEVRDG